MLRKGFIKVLIAAAFFTFLSGITHTTAFAAESGFYDGTWKAGAFTGSFEFVIENNRVEPFSLIFEGNTYDFDSATVDLKKNCFETRAGVSSLRITFDPSDNTVATGDLIIWPDDPNAIGGWSAVSADNTNPKNQDLTYPDKTAWVNILPDKDQKLADSLACLNDLAWNGKNYVIVGRGKILTSTDGVSWKITYSTEVDKALYGVVWDGKEYIALGTDEANSAAIVMKSTNGTDWEKINPKINGYIRDIACNDKVYAAVGDAGMLITSSDGTKWRKADISVTKDFTNIIWVGNKFVAVGDNVIATSSDGSDWNIVPGQSGMFYGITYYNEQYCIIDLSGKLLITKDFKKWSSKQVDLPGSESYISHAACSKEIILIEASSPEGVLSSADMTKWSMDSLKQDKDDVIYINNIVYANGKFFAVGPGYISLYIPPETSKPDDQQIDIIINGSKQSLSQAPYLSGDVLMLPVESVLKAAGAEVKISENKVTITKGTKKATLTVNSSAAVLNKDHTKLEAKAVLKNDTVYAPLGKVVEALGGTFTWDAAKKTVTIKFKT